MRARVNGTRLGRLVEDFLGWIFTSKMLEVFMPGLLHPPGAFGPSFDPTRLVAPWSLDDDSLGDPAPHFHSLAFAQDRTTAEIGEPLPAGVEHLLGPAEAEAPVIDSVDDSGLEHQQADEVVEDHVHEDFFDDHLGRLRAQQLHSQGGLDVAETHLDFPPMQVERGDLLGRIVFTVQQSGHHVANPGFAFAIRSFAADDAHFQRVGERRPLGHVEPTSLRGIARLLPDDDPLVRADPAASAEVDLAGLMGATDKVRAPIAESGDELVSAVEPVGDEDIAFSNILGLELLVGAQLTGVYVGMRKVAQASMAQVDEPAEFDHGHAAAFALPRGTGPEITIGLGVGHLGGGAVFGEGT